MQCYNCNSKRLKYDKDIDAYVCLDCHYQFPKQYFFISHSHLDIEKVRIVRNVVEETFFYEPILFFLKCLSEDKEISDLIRREINERVWFIYCKSENAENSKYVREEREYIDYLISNGYDKKVLTIDLDGFEIWDDECVDHIRKQVAFKIRKTKIFISYQQSDAPVASPIYEELSKNGFGVWYDKKTPYDDLWGEHTNSKIKEHSYKDGICMPILSGNADPRLMIQDLESAIKRDAFILPVIVKSGENQNDILEILPKNIADYLKDGQQFVFDVDTPFESARKLVEFINAL